MNNMRLLMVLVAAVLVVSCNRGQQSQPADQPATTTQQAPAPTQPAPPEAAPPAAAPAPAPAPPSAASRRETREENRRVERSAREENRRVEPSARATEGTAGSSRAATADDTRTTRPVYAEITVPAGTPLQLSLDTPLTTETAKIEDPVRARLRDAVVIDGRQVLPAGALVLGNITETERPGRMKGVARLAFRFNEMEFRNERVKLNAAPISIQGEATHGEDAEKIGIGAGVGAAIGAIAGGKSGAAKGAAIGGAAGTGAVVATRGKEIELAKGATVSTRLNDPVKVQVPVR